MKSEPWFVGAQSPEMQYPLRYPGWGVYRPRKKAIWGYMDWWQRHFWEMVFPRAGHLVERLVERFATDDPPFFKWLKR